MYSFIFLHTQNLFILFIISYFQNSVFQCYLLWKLLHFLCLIYSKCLSCSSSTPAPRRRACAEEKGAGGLFQDERVRRMCEPKFPQQALQVCALPRLFEHIGDNIRPCLAASPANPPHMSADQGSVLSSCCFRSFRFPPSCSSFILMSIWYFCFNSIFFPFKKPMYLKLALSFANRG